MIQLDALKKRPERHTDKQTNKQKLTCRSSANFVSAGQKYQQEEVEEIGGWTDTQDYLLGLDDAMANDNLGHWTTL